MKLCSGRRSWADYDMGGYVPNPIAVVGLKWIAYTAVGALVRRSAEHQGNPLVFGAVRVVLGWIIGGPTLLALAWVTNGAGLPDWFVLLLLPVPRVPIWSVLLHIYFRPRGGRLPLAYWTGVGVIVSTLTDLLIFGLFDDIPFLRIGIC